VTLCRELTPQLVQILFRHAQSDNAPVSLRASTWLLERGWGRAPQPLELHEESGLVPQHFRSDLEHAIQAHRERLYGRCDREDEDDQEGDDEFEDEAEDIPEASGNGSPAAPASSLVPPSAGARAVETASPEQEAPSPKRTRAESMAEHREALNAALPPEGWTLPEAESWLIQHIGIHDFSPEWRYHLLMSWPPVGGRILPGPVRPCSMA
jgi:hypothetical protein